MEDKKILNDDELSDFVGGLADEAPDFKDRMLEFFKK